MVCAGDGPEDGPVGECGAGGITYRKPFAIRRNPVRVWDAHAARRAVPGEHHVVIGIDLRQVRELAVVGADDARGDLERGAAIDLTRPLPPTVRLIFGTNRSRSHRPFQSLFWSIPILE